MLWHIDRELIDRTLLPLGDLKKDEVREYANEKELETSNVPDSQDLCFVMDGDYRNFLNKFMPEKMEKIDGGNIENEDGGVVGKHTGFTNYTIGQRKGLGLSNPEPRYVKKINPISNTITVAKKESMFSKNCTTIDINWLVDPPDFPFKALTKIRYNSLGAMASIIKQDEKYIITFDEPQLAITPGQSIVFYNEDTLMGGGIIKERDDE
jgi:tRNA-specific 2-thiouridylase